MKLPATFHPNRNSRNSSLRASRWFNPGIAGLALLAAYCAQAQTLTQAVALALENEPTYLAAKATTAASREKSRQASGGLLPQVSASASSNYNQRDYLTRNSPNGSVADSFNSNNRQLTVTQPLWRQASHIAVSQAESVVLQSDHLLFAARQDLLAKLVTAWCDAMLARDVILFNRRQVETTRQEVTVHERSLALGASSAPALEEARAKHEQARADQATSEADLNVKTAQLEQLIGPLRGFEPPYLSSLVTPRDFGDRGLDAWLEEIETANPAILAAMRNLEASNEEVRKQRAGHQPTLDLVGNINRNSQAVGGFPGQNGYDISQRAIGLQLNIPIYSGGTQTAKTDEAIALQEKARQELEGARRAARLTVKQAWFGRQAGQARGLAALQALKSATLVLNLAVTGQSKGVKTELDILQARQLVEAAKRDFNRSRYDLITSSFKLLAAAGKLGEADITALQGFMLPHPEDLREGVVLK